MSRAHDYDIHFVLLSLNVVLILSNCADPDKMQHDAAFYLGLHCLPNNPLRDFKYTKVKVKCICIQQNGLKS